MDNFFNLFKGKNKTATKEPAMIEMQEMNQIGPLLQEDDKQLEVVKQPLAEQQEQQQETVPWYKKAWQKTAMLAQSVKLIPALVKAKFPKYEIPEDVDNIQDAYKTVHSGHSMWRKNEAAREQVYDDKEFDSESVKDSFESESFQEYKEIDTNDPIADMKLFRTVLSWNMKMFKFENDEELAGSTNSTLLVSIKQARQIEAALHGYSKALREGKIKEPLDGHIVAELQARSEYMKQYSAQVAPRLAIMNSKYYKLLSGRDFSSWSDAKFREKQREARESGNDELADFLGAVQLKKKMSKQKNTFKKGQDPEELMSKLRAKQGGYKADGDSTVTMKEKLLASQKRIEEDKKKKEAEEAAKKEEEKKKEAEKAAKKEETKETTKESTEKEKEDLETLVKQRADYEVAVPDGIGADYEKQDRSLDCYSVVGMKLINHFRKMNGISDKAPVTQEEVRLYQPVFKKLEESGFTDQKTYDADKEAILKFLNGNTTTAMGNLYAMGDFLLEQAPGAMIRKMVFTPSSAKIASPLVHEKVREKFKASVHSSLVKVGAVGVLAGNHYRTIVGMKGEKVTVLDSNRETGELSKTPKEINLDDLFYGDTVELTWLEKEDLDSVKAQFKSVKQEDDGSISITKEQPIEETVAQINGIAVSKEQDEKEPELADYYQDSVYFMKPKQVTGEQKE